LVTSTLVAQRESGPVADSGGGAPAAVRIAVRRAGL
jgi:hypothetical protein